MATWKVLLSAILLYAHSVDCEFGEKIETNETVSQSSSSADINDSPNMMIVPVIPENGVELHKAVLTDMTTEEGGKEIPSSTPTAFTESSYVDISPENGITDINKLQYPFDNDIKKAPTNAWDEIGFNNFDHISEEPTAPTYFEHTNIQPSNSTKENNKLEQQEDFSESKYMNKDYVNRWNSFPIMLKPTPNTPLFDDSLNAKRLLNDINEQNRLYQIAATESYIKQIEYEQEYAKGLHNINNGITPITKSSPVPEVAFGIGSSYVHQPFTSPSVFSVLSPGFNNLGLRSPYNNAERPFSQNYNKYNSGLKDSSLINDPYSTFGSIGRKQWSSLDNGWEGNKGQWNTPFSQLNTNQWSPLSHQWQPNFQDDHGSSL